MVILYELILINFSRLTTLDGNHAAAKQVQWFTLVHKNVNCD